MSQPYAQYPRNQKREVSFSVISDAFEIFKNNPGPFVVVTLVQVIACGIVYAINMAVNVAMGLGTTFMPSGGNDTAAVGAMMGAQFMSMGLGLVFSIIIYIVAAGFVGSATYMALKELNGQRAEMGDLGWGFQNNFAQLAIAMVLINLGVTLGTYCCILPGLLLAGLWMITIPAMVDEKMGAIDAMRFSFNTMRDHMWMAAVLYVVLGLIAFVGILLCGVGALATIPIMYISLACIYRDMTGMGGDVAPAGPGGMTPPGPSDPNAAPGGYGYEGQAADEEPRPADSGSSPFGSVGTEAEDPGPADPPADSPPDGSDDSSGPGSSSPYQ